MCWFSPSNATEVSEDALKSDNKFSGHEASALKSIQQHHENSGPNNACLPINDSNKKSVPIGNQMNSQTSDIDDPAALGQLSFVNGSDTKIGSRNDLTPKEQVVLMISNDCLP